jgi:hypothetical protein
MYSRENLQSRTSRCYGTCSTVPRGGYCWHPEKTRGVPPGSRSTILRQSTTHLRTGRELPREVCSQNAPLHAGSRGIDAGFGKLGRTVGQFYQDSCKTVRRQADSRTYCFTSQLNCFVMWKIEVRNDI